MSNAPMNSLYRIKHPNGTYSKGGMCPEFSKRGKVWTNIGHVKNHIHGLGRGSRQLYKDCTLETYTITETVHKSEPVLELMDDLRATVAAREQARIAERKAEEKERELEQLKRLNQKYPEGK